MKETNITLLEDAKVVKKSFYSGIRDIFKKHINKQSKYSSLDISSILINAISRNMYIESYVRNYNDNNDMPSGDTLFRRVKGTRGVCNNGYEKNSGSDMVSKMIDLTVIKAKSIGSFNNRVNVAIDEHDEPYYGYYNNKLVYTPYHKYRGTEKAYRFATMESVGNPRMALVTINYDGSSATYMLVLILLPEGIYSVGTSLLDLTIFLTHEKLKFPATGFSFKINNVSMKNTIYTGLIGSGFAFNNTQYYKSINLLFEKPDTFNVTLTFNIVPIIITGIYHFSLNGQSTKKMIYNFNFNVTS